MKKMLVGLLILGLIAGTIVGCGNSGNTPSEEVQETSGETEDTTGDTAGDTTEDTTEPEKQADTDLAGDYAKIPDEELEDYVDNDTFDVGEMKDEYKIGIAAGTMGSAYFKALPDQAEETLKSYGCEVLVADANGDIQTQVNQLENFIAQGVNGILINSVDPPSAVSTVLDKAMEAGIPVVAVDSRLDSTYKNYLGMIGSDNYNLGFEVGAYMGNYLKEKKGAVEGTCCVLDGVEGNVVAEARYKGFWDGIASVDSNHKVEEVAHLYGGGWTEEAGVQMAEDMLVANAEIDLMFGISDPFVVGAKTAAERAGRDEMIMGAVDGAKNAFKFVQDGTVIKVIGGQDPVGMGVIGSELLLAYLNNGTLPESKIMKIAPRVATPETVDDIYDPESAF